jgi:hypothetical protein
VVKIVTTLSLIGCMIVPQAALAQAPRHPWHPEDRTSRLLTVVSTDAVLVECDDIWSTSCFRVILRIAPGEKSTVDVGHIPTGRNRGSTAFTSTGASCREYGSRGLPEPRMWSSGTLRWRDPPFRVTPERAATLLIEYGCDGGIAAGDEVTIQFDLAVDPDERGISVARYAAQGLKLVKMPGLSSRRQ